MAKRKSRTRPRGFIEPKGWGFDRLTLLDNIRRVLDEYTDYLPLSLRQIFYALVGKGEIPKTEDYYKYTLKEALVEFRRARVIPFEHIVDRTRVMSMGYDFVSEAHLERHLEALRRHARMDLQLWQDRRLWLLVEAAGLASQVERVAHEYGISVVPGRGFPSVTAKYDFAMAVNDGDLIMHMGDLDPSGWHIAKNMREEFAAFGRDVEVETILVTPEQVAEHELITAPPKRTDNRSYPFTWTCQAEAFRPDQLERVLREEIESRLDMAAHAEALEWQARIRGESE